jgi:hypothetical protein
MRTVRNRIERSSDEGGAVMVFFALLTPLLVLLLILVIDVSNWFEHKRHLQVQADAGALAAAQAFQPCSNGGVYAAAGQYAGVPSVATPSGSATSGGPLYNEQTGGTPSSKIHALVNSKTFYNQASTRSPSTPDDTTVSDPCDWSSGQTPMVDVKLTETDLPWYFKALASVPFINAQARVSILQQTSAPGMEAIAVSESAPVAARAYFVNEDVSAGQNGWILSSTPLYKEPGQNSQGQDVWDNSGSDPSGRAVPLSVQVSHPHIGVVVAFSGDKNTTTCGDPYVQCFDTSSTTGPSLVHIQGWSAAGAGSLASPVARSVTLSTPAGRTCTDGYFSNSTTTCSATISAWVDYGTTNTNGVSVKPVVAGTAEGELSPGARSGTAVQWTGTVSLKIAGSNQIDLLVACKKGTDAACGSSADSSARIPNVQRSYAANTNSGSITGAWVSEVGGALQGANSFEVCETQNATGCSHTLIVTVNVTGSLANAQSFSDPLYTMRFGSSQSNVVACGPRPSPSGDDYRQNLAEGCTGPFVVNTSDPTCQLAATSPYDCIRLANGVKEGPIRQGIGDRVVNAPPSGTRYYCPSNWTNNNGGAVPAIPSDDSRIVNVFVMPYGSTDANGVPLLDSGYVPIEAFATFYITGFDGDPCAGDPTAQKSQVVGHFIKYVDTTGGGTGDGGCSLSSLGTCVAILTK